MPAKRIIPALDITASHERRDMVSDLAARVTEQAFIPFTVGGGLKTTDEMRAVLAAGADKIFINTAAFTNPDLIREGAQRFGVQCIVVAIDAKQTAPDKWEVFLHGGRTPTGRDAVEWAREAARSDLEAALIAYRLMAKEIEVIGK